MAFFTFKLIDVRDRYYSKVHAVLDEIKKKIQTIKNILL